MEVFLYHAEHFEGYELCFEMDKDDSSSSFVQILVNDKELEKIRGILADEAAVLVNNSFYIDKTYDHKREQTNIKIMIKAEYGQSILTMPLATFAKGIETALMP